ADKIILLLMLLTAFAGPVSTAGAQEYGGGPIVFIKPVRAVIFEHKYHLGRELKCQSCHPDLFARKAGEVEQKDDFTMASFEQGKYCGKCHDGTRAFAVTEKCNWCHIGVQGHKKLEEYELGIK
ncbi:MAG: cytochrome c3 family protein, partial [Desulfobulbales bacterium]|nr:cytochrome c3 family protein [Desulfobulbales bacterium]